MIPGHLLYFAAQEFLNYSQAIRNSLSGRETIQYTMPEAEDDEDHPEYTRYSTHQLVLKQLPSGLWSFLPTNNEDLAALAIFKESITTFGTTKIIQYHMKVCKKEEKEKGKDYAEKILKRHLFLEFSQKIDPSKAYQIKYEGCRVDNDFSNSFERKLYKVYSASLLYAESVTPDINETPEP